MNATSDQVEAGRTFTPNVRSPFTTGRYRFFRVAWKCPLGGSCSTTVDAFRRTISTWESGPGTSWTAAGSSRLLHRVALMDPNTNCLEVSSRRIDRYNPEVYEANVLEPIPFDVVKFDSVGLNYVLHCIPGDIATKAVVFENLKALMNPGGVVFGATLLHDGVRRIWLARQVMDRNNKHGIFTNVNDSLDGLRLALSQHFTDSAVEVVGCVGIFTGSL